MGNDTVHLMVVDDVADIAETLAAQLELDGYTVRTAYTVEQAIRGIEQQVPHCVLLDIGMPGIDGYELASMLRHRFKDEMLLIAVTGSDEAQPRVSESFSVVDHYFRKPVDLTALRKVLPALAASGQRV